MISVTRHSKTMLVCFLFQLHFLHIPFKWLFDRDEINKMKRSGNNLFSFRHSTVSIHERHVSTKEVYCLPIIMIESIANDCLLLFFEMERAFNANVVQEMVCQ